MMAAALVAVGLRHVRFRLAHHRAGLRDALRRHYTADLEQECAQLDRAAASARAQLREANDRLRATTEHAPIGVMTVDLDPGAGARVLSANRALGDLLGYEATMLVGRRLTSMLDAEHAGRLLRELSRLSRDAEARVEVEVRCTHRDGHPVWLALSGLPVRDASSGVGRVGLLHAMDIGERKQLEGQLQHLADHDPLTGLFNRRRFEEELTRAVAEANRYTHPGAVLMMDLDGFRFVNDTMGHGFGDELIARLGGAIAGALRETDLVARLGGDEFGVILPHTDAAEAQLVCDKILAALRCVAISLDRQREARMGASIGITTFDPDTRVSAEQLIVEADIAMYEAKEAGKNRALLYLRERESPSGMFARESWRGRVVTALAENGFELMAQPLLGVCGNGVARYELLLRMRGENDELIAPGAFLGVAERFDLVQQIDRWVFAQAARLLSLSDAAGQNFSLSVNMSGKTITDPHVLEDVRAILAEHAVRPGRLVVEVTETAAIVNIERAREVARGLRELGCRFALDDFGSGFASFYYLKHLEFDFLKIDGEFIHALWRNPTDQLVVRSVVQIARGLGAKTIAEFVADDQVLKCLGKLGVDYAQGYHVGRPVPVRDVLGVDMASPAA